MEGIAAKIIGKIEDGNYLPKPLSEDHLLLVMYILMQRSRTRGGASSIEQFQDKAFKLLIKTQKFAEYAKSIGYDISEFNEDEYIISAEYPSIYSLGITMQGFPIAMDLVYKVLVNKTQEEFITSDDPVVLVNSMIPYQKEGQVSYTGWASRGLQIFFPISPRKILLFYDNWAYSVGKTSSLITDITCPKDVNDLNKLQLLSSSDCAYYRDGSFKIFELPSKFSSDIIKNRKRVESVHYKNYETNEEIVGIHQVDIRTKLNVSVIRLKQRAKKWIRERKNFQFHGSVLIPSLDCRDKELHDIFSEFRGKGMEGLGKIVEEILKREVLERIWSDHFSHQYPGNVEDIKENHLYSFFLCHLYDKHAS